MSYVQVFFSMWFHVTLVVATRGETEHNQLTSALFKHFFQNWIRGIMIYD